MTRPTTTPGTAEAAPTPADHALTGYDPTGYDLTGYDALLYVSFGGPERPEEIMPFLHAVTAGRPVSDERLERVAEHYHAVGGRSPINDQNRAVIAALRQRLREAGTDLPVYFGNRNWRPWLADALREMADDGVERALAYVTAGFASSSSCRQYREDLARARAEVGADIAIDKLRVFYNHPGFVAAQAAQLEQALDSLAPGQREQTRLLFTAHSLPDAMARHCDYEIQLHEAARLVVGELGSRTPGGGWEVLFCSASGPPGSSWLGPDVAERIRGLDAARAPAVAVVPIGFVSDHVEVRYDLDVEAREAAGAAGVAFVRAGTVGTHPRFVAMILQLVAERTDPDAPRLALGTRGPHHDRCPPDCCLVPGRPAPEVIASADT